MTGAGFSIAIGDRIVGPGQSTYIVAEMSANHGRDFDRAVDIIKVAKRAGADAIKVQTFTAETHTIESNAEWFRVKGGTAWDGRTLFELYREAAMPLEWQPRLQAVAREEGLDFFSAAVDATSVDFLESLRVPVHKLASFELVDLPLIRHAARTGKPLILSTGMATLEEIDESVRAARESGARELLLLKCTSAYPSPAEDMNLRTIADMSTRYGAPVGLSDHTTGIAVPVAAVALGACLIEKHLTLSRGLGGPDAGFSLEPDEFTDMVAAIRVADRALGSIHYGLTSSEHASVVFRRSLFVVRDVKAGEPFTADNVRSIRPGYGLHTRHLDEIMGGRAAHDIAAGTPLSWALVQKGSATG
jgi:N-acetylneuraminate synthase